MISYVCTVCDKETFKIGNHFSNNLLYYVCNECIYNTDMRPEKIICGSVDADILNDIIKEANKEKIIPLLPEPPEPPHSRVINESLHCGWCPKCNSSLKRKYIFFGHKSCMHKKCDYGK